MVSNPITEIHRLLGEARKAIANRDAESASWIATALSLELAVTPDGSKEGNAGASLSFDRQAIENTINQLKAFVRSGFGSQNAGIGVTQVEYARGHNEYGTHTDTRHPRYEKRHRKGGGYHGGHGRW